MNILHQSKHFVVVEKDPDIVINSDDPSVYSVEKWLLSESSLTNYRDASVKHSFRFVHRLDYSTSGLMCIALTKKAAQRCFHAFQRKQVTKHYLALVRGHVMQKETEICQPITACTEPGQEHTMCVAPEMGAECQGKAKAAETALILLEHGTYDGETASKVLLIPKTGRRHQLRVHCNYIGHTIVGDFTYSNRQDTKPHRMMLHAYRLRIPLSLETLDFRTEDPFLESVDPLWKCNTCFTKYDDCVNGKSYD